MKKILTIMILSIALSGCAFFSEDNEEEVRTSIVTDAEYADFAKNVTVVAQKEDYVEYEYKNIRVDDMAVLAALYCHDQDKKKAYLDKIILYQNNARRAKFICR